MWWRGQKKKNYDRLINCPEGRELFDKIDEIGPVRLRRFTPKTLSARDRCDFNGTAETSGARIITRDMRVEGRPALVRSNGSADREYLCPLVRMRPARCGLWQKTRGDAGRVIRDSSPVRFRDFLGNAKSNRRRRTRALGHHVSDFAEKSTSALQDFPRSPQYFSSPFSKFADRLIRRDTLRSLNLYVHDHLITK